MNSNKILKLQQAIEAKEAAGQPTRALEAQLRQLLRDQDRKAAREAKEVSHEYQ